MLKKFGITAVSFFMCASALCADGNDMRNKDMKTQDPMHYTGGFTLGMNLSTLDGTGAGMNLGYYGSCWLVDVSANYSHLHEKTNFTNVTGHLGLRSRLHNNLFFDYGAMGYGGFVDSHGHSDNTWGVGAFFGFSYQLSRNFLIAGKTYPYNYRHSKINQVFANGTLAFLYVF
jgi:hypothetical protein